MSGFESVRHYIRSKVTGGLHLYEKTEGQTGAALRLWEVAEKSLATLRTQLQCDKELQRRIQSRLSCGHGRSSKEVDGLADRLTTKYDSIANEFKRTFREGLEIGRIFKRIWPGTESSKDWLVSLQKRFEERLSSKLEKIAKQEAEFFVDDVKNLMKELLNDLDRITNPKDAFNTAEQLDRRRSEVAEGVKTKLDELSQNVAAMLETVAGSADNLPTTVAGGSAVAVIGTVIAVCLKAAVFDITGGRSGCPWPCDRGICPSLETRADH